MAFEDDSIEFEKVDVDFTDGLNNFGIQDTQVIEGDNLNSFLTGTTETVEKVKTKNTEGDDKKETSESIKLKEEQEKAKNQKRKEEEDLQNFLLEEKEDNIDSSLNKNTEKSDNNSQPSDTEDSEYNVLSKDLFRLGVFTQIYEDETEENIEVKTPEEFLERFNSEKKKGAVNIVDNFLRQYGEEYREMFDSVFVKGVDPKEYLRSFTKIQSIKNLDLTEESNQEKVVEAYYRSLKWDDDKIANRIKKLKDFDSLEEESATFKDILLAKEEDAEKELVAKKDRQIQDEIDRTRNLQSTFSKVLNEKLVDLNFDGIPLTKEDAQEIVGYILNKPFQISKTNELISEYDRDLMELNKPENAELKLKLALLLKKKLDLTTVKIANKTKESKELFKIKAFNKTGNKTKSQEAAFFD